MTPTMLMILIPIAVGLTFLYFMAFHLPRGVRSPAVSPERPLDREGVPPGAQRLLVAVDGSPTSDATISEVAKKSWPEGSQIEVVTVIHAQVPVFPDPAFSMAAVHAVQEQLQAHKAPALLEAAVSRLQSASPGVTVSSKVLEGDPAGAIVDEAQRLGADKIFVGSHGHGAVWHSLMGSVSQKVVAYAPCSVHIVRAA